VVHGFGDVAELGCELLGHFDEGLLAQVSPRKVDCQAARQDRKLLVGSCTPKACAIEPLSQAVGVPLVERQGTAGRR
jgi:hypothetical protein